MRTRLAYLITATIVLSLPLQAVASGYHEEEKSSTKSSIKKSSVKKSSTKKSSTKQAQVPSHISAGLDLRIADDGFAEATVTVDPAALVNSIEIRAGGEIAFGPAEEIEPGVWAADSTDPVYSGCVEARAEIEIGGGSSRICEERPSAVTFRYLGGGCDQTTNDQLGRVTCSGDAGHHENVRIIAGQKGSIYADVSGVMIGDLVDAAAALAGDDELSSNTLLEVYDANGMLLQTVNVHTSCSKPMAIGDVFGAFELVDFVNTEESEASVSLELSTAACTRHGGTRPVCEGEPG